MICKYILLIAFLNESKLICLHTVKWFQVLLCISKNSIKHQSFVYTQLNDQMLLFLSGAITPGQSGPRSDSNEGVLHIPQSSSFTRALPSNGLVSYSYSSVEQQLVYSTTPINWADIILSIHTIAAVGRKTFSFFVA